MKKTKIIVVGANHAGTSFLRTMATINPEAELITYDRNSNISFLGCGIALWIGGEFEDPSGLFYSSSEQLTGMGVNVKMEHDVIEIKEKEKKVVVRDLKTNKVFEDSYDKLVFAGGSWPIIPPFKGVDLKGIYLVKLFQHAQKIKELIKDHKIKNIAVVGAGYIGIELVEAFVKFGKKVTLIDMQEHVISNYFDSEFTVELEKRMIAEGVVLRLGSHEKVSHFEGKNGYVTKVVLAESEVETDMVIVCVGAKPNTQLLAGKVEMIANGAIKVNDCQETSNKDIYALGDSAALQNNCFNDYCSVALATNAVKTGIVAALHIAGNTSTHLAGVQGTNAIQVFGTYFTSTGMSEETVKMRKMKYATEFLVDNDRPEFMREFEKVYIKIVYDPETLRLLGAQIASFDSPRHTEAIYALSLAIQQKLTLPEIALMDFYFLPHLNKPFNYIITVILNAIGIKY